MIVKESLIGGKGDKLTEKNVDKRQLIIGKIVEKEHSPNEKITTEIALDHLAENKKYYSNLVEKGIVDEPNAIRLYIKYFGTSKLPKKYHKFISESMNDILKPKSSNEIQKVLFKLNEIKNIINNIDPRIKAYTLQEWLTEFPWQKDDWVNGYYLIITNDINKTEDILNGGFSVSLINDNIVKAEWLPYPEETIIGIDNFISALKELIREYDNKFADK